MGIANREKQARHAKKQTANGMKLMRMYVPIKREAALKQMVKDAISEHYKAKYIIKCYNRHGDLMLRPDNMEDAHEWIDQNDGYFLVEVVK